MKATELAKAFNEIDDAYLAELDTSEKERITMKNRKKFSRILIAAAVICLLSITAFAAEHGFFLFSCGLNTTAFGFCQMPLHFPAERAVISSGK